MKKNQSERNNVTAESGSKCVLAYRLRDAGVGIERSASVEEGEKTCYDHDDKRPPTEIAGNYTIFGGRGLVILDVDIPIDDLPDWVFDLPSTFVVESPHEGHHVYFAVENDDDISNSKTDWGSIRYAGQYSVGPGSTIDHSLCPDGKAGCPGEEIGRYEISVDKPIAILSGDHLGNLREACQSSSGDHSISKEEFSGEQITLPDDILADEGEQYICTDFTCREDTGDLASREIMDFLRGGSGSYELRRDDDTGIDQSAANYYALEMLYGAFRFRGEGEDDARRFALAVFKRYCRENPYDKTGNLRKWLRKGEQYLQEQMDAVQREFDQDKWNRWRRRDHKNGFNGHEHTPWADPDKDGIPSLITQDTVRATLHILTSGLDPQYVAHQYGLDTSHLPPTSCGEMFTPGGSTSSCDSREYPVAREVGEAAAKLNPERKASYFAETVKKLSRETDEVAHAYCPSRPNGERHVYYISEFSDPEDARWVKINGEERDPESVEQEVMTDGGTVSTESESGKKLEPIRKARQGSDRSDYEPDVYRCPIDGCDRIVIDDPGSLRHHVRQSSDKTHQHRRMNKDLEIETEWSKMDWSPGAPV